jgi:hypothetical protein
MKAKNHKESFLKDYEKIVSPDLSYAVVIKTEWRTKGDFFEKLSIYDDSSFIPIKSLGETTLINAI